MRQSSEVSSRATRWLPTRWTGRKLKKKKPADVPYRSFLTNMKGKEKQVFRYSKRIQRPSPTPD
jgi:hypothetical protein